MGDWIYYATCLPMREIDQRVSLVSKIHKSSRLSDWIQRQVDESKHSESIKTYLLSQKQRLFNAIVLGVYGGSPNWRELHIETSNGGNGIPENLEGSLGVLSLSGREKLFAIDGQHRVVGIRKALQEDKSVGSEEVCALLVSHSGDSKGRQRTRRLFSTLNRYAKPVSKMENIALDEDDVVAITTRRLVDDYQLLHDFISLKRGNSLPKSDKRSLSTVTALYDGLDAYLPSLPKKQWEELKRMRPPDAELEKYYVKAVQFWDSLKSHFPEIQGLAKSRLQEQVASKYRGEFGGHLLFRPIGLTMVFRVCKLLLDDGRSIEQIHQQFSRVPMLLRESPWEGLIWDPVAKIMNADSERQKAATRILYHGLGGDLQRMKTTVALLKETLGGMLGRDPASVELPLWTH
jgi:DNA sulfur modification protein DndB